MGLLDFVKTKNYKTFMAKLYGWGAAVVIIGALFKINHYTGADTMLIIGLGTESIIFFFSAFEPPHVEPDWSLVYPQLAGIYHDAEIDVPSQNGSKDSVSQELDQMLSKAKIGPELIESLGVGLKSLSETTSGLSKVTHASLANEQYVNTLKNATQSAALMNDAYRKTSQTLEQSATATEEQLNNIKSTSKSAATLAAMFTEVSASLKEDISANKAFSDSISNAAGAANKFIEKYSESATLLSKTAETLSASATQGTQYNKELQRISTNLSALNALYELHVQGSNQQIENTKKFNSTLNNFAANLNESMTNANRFKTEVDNLTHNIAALNKVYGNMLSAMNVGNK
ncbi:MAG: gliding motility protein GldL [Bacteroidota bacterium]